MPSPPPYTTLDIFCPVSFRDCFFFYLTTDNCDSAERPTGIDHGLGALILGLGYRLFAARFLPVFQFAATKANTLP